MLQNSPSQVLLSYFREEETEAQGDKLLAQGHKFLGGRAGFGTLAWMILKPDGEFGIDMYTLLYLKQITRASLVAQWLRICLLMQGTRVRALVWEDPTCRGATGPVSHNY